MKYDLKLFPITGVAYCKAAEAELLNLEGKGKEDLGREADKPKGVLDVWHYIVDG